MLYRLEIYDDLVFFDRISSGVLTSNNHDKYTHQNLEIPPEIYNEIDKNIENDTEVSKHFEKYQKRIIESKDSNKIIRNLFNRNMVLIKKDLRINTKTKRTPFDYFYDDSVFTVTNIFIGNMIELENVNAEKRTV
ncbi:hypothetical protein CWI38_1198p0010 [Hamiltosporidium tvaerminnensis]|uniref:Uncharacterized protein n=1 Tax=Hamiltosporidium tvaerminnensis TaxID=1176355 RepID=A0A4Q9LSB0_9MICR|nr:hypothetical protein CWI37_1282p0010 [Hamiltosporidium tvaerminnensis]TBU11453.1 hypothetical protein CWI38_1198p0010 [Hamiltosporidium tvaerminnensis]